eukprot:m.142103 g.142103  ORF g.142103 m.142103 type:complete len:352 (-) comp17133_c0_seq1:103-1158(-)
MVELPARALHREENLECVTWDTLRLENFEHVLQCSSRCPPVGLVLARPPLQQIQKKRINLLSAMQLGTMEANRVSLDRAVCSLVPSPQLHRLHMSQEQNVFHEIVTKGLKESLDIVNGDGGARPQFAHCCLLLGAQGEAKQSAIEGRVEGIAVKAGKGHGLELVTQGQRVFGAGLGLHSRVFAWVQVRQELARRVEGDKKLAREEHGALGEMVDRRKAKAKFACLSWVVLLAATPKRKQTIKVVFAKHGRVVCHKCRALQCFHVALGAFVHVVCAMLSLVQQKRDAFGPGVVRVLQQLTKDLLIRICIEVARNLPSNAGVLAYKTTKGLLALATGWCCHDSVCVCAPSLLL